MGINALFKEIRNKMLGEIIKVETRKKREVEVIKRNSGYCTSNSPMRQPKSCSLFIRDMSSMPSMPSIHEQTDDTNTSGHHLDRTDGHCEEITEESIVLANEKHYSTNYGTPNDKRVNSMYNIGSGKIDKNGETWINIPLSERMTSSDITVKTITSSRGGSLHWKKEFEDSITCIVRGKAAFILNIKAAKRISLLVGECLFCWLIYDIIVLRNISGHYDKVVTQIGRCIMYSSLFLNPLVYGMYNPAIKKIVMKRFRDVMENFCNNKSNHGNHRENTESTTHK